MSAPGKHILPSGRVSAVAIVRRVISISQMPANTAWPTSDGSALMRPTTYIYISIVTSIIAGRLGLFASVLEDWLLDSLECWNLIVVRCLIFFVESGGFGVLEVGLEMFISESLVFGGGFWMCLSEIRSVIPLRTGSVLFIYCLPGTVHLSERLSRSNPPLSAYGPRRQSQRHWSDGLSKSNPTNPRFKVAFTAT
jgi:hypothetical protein